MKKIYRKQLTKAIALAVIVINLPACTNNGNTATTTNADGVTKNADARASAEEHNEAKFNTRENERNAEYLVKAAEINLEEIELGKLAQQKGKMKEVKELGTMMEKEHTKAMEEVRKLAEKKMITIPTSLSQSGKDDYDKLNSRTGDNFDKEYCDKMVNGHKDAISLFEKMTESKDTEIKSWASSMLPTLRKHLDHSMSCRDKIKTTKV